MALEIEKKYLVIDDSFRSMASKSVVIKQGYLSTCPNSTVRIRVKADKAFITVKSTTIGITRNEWEYEIPIQDATDMISKCCTQYIHKTRYLINYHGYQWEVDEFHGNLSPLIIAEIELPSEDTIVPIPPFIGKEVSGDKRYYNSNLINASYEELA
jgi:adenylate cyclase